MSSPSESAHKVRFGPYDADFRAGELLKNGRKIRLQEQPFQILAILLEQPGGVVTREELRQRLWPTDTFVDFDHGLNNAINKLRDALNDSADAPRFIETLPRRGYRFIAELNGHASTASRATVHADSIGAGEIARAVGPEETALAKPPPAPSLRRVGKFWPAAAGVGVTAALILGLYFGRGRPLRTNAAAKIHSVAVLPLENLSGDPSQDYFAAGLTDALTTELARAVGASVRVTSRVSAEKYKGKPLAQIARELDVDAVIEGSVVRSGNRARVTAQLVDARADKHLWAATYDRDLHDLLSVESEIAATVTRQVQITLSPKAQERLATPIPVDPQAYDLYLRGRYRAFSNNPQDFAQSIGFLEQAVALEPNFGAAHALLGRAYITQVFFVQPEEQALDAKALAEVNRALELDPDLADAYLARGLIYWTHRNGFPHERAIREIKHAIELDPNLAEAHHWLGTIFLHVGLLDEAEQELHTALQLEPTNMGARYRIAVVLLDEGKPQQAVADLEGTRPFVPDLWAYQMAFALFQLGRKEEATALITDYLRDNPRDRGGVGNAMQALLYADAGRATLAEQSIQAAMQKGKDFGHFHHAAYTIAAAYALMNRPQDAVRWLRAAAEDGFPCYPLFEHDSNLDHLRNDPRFLSFLAEQKKQWEYFRGHL
jgi:TolB-like protein/DNA-binding winged helix-turn-helix (wHTH) protein